MHGSWHRYAHDERWRRPRHQAGIVLETADDVFVCFSPSEVEVLRAGGARAAGLARGLGPDLTVAGFDPRATPARARGLWHPSALVAEVLLDQRIAAGIGNVYKSELCFLERVDPRRTLGSLEDATIARLYARAHELLRANLGGGPRATRRTAGGEGSLWIYGRTRKGCGACGGPVSSGELGARPRVTYWCRRCQGTHGGAS
jgi:endonuclease-8